MQLPSVIDLKEVGESSLEAALPWDRIQGAPFAAWHDQRPVIALPSLVPEETSRELRDPDYHFLVEDVAALNKVRAEKTLPLNLKVRQEQRAQLDKERLERANQRLLAEGQPPVKTVEELDKNTPADFESNLLLGQAAQVMADILVGDTPNQHLPGTPPPQQTVKR